MKIPHDRRLNAPYPFGEIEELGAPYYIAPARLGVLWPVYNANVPAAILVAYQLKVGAVWGP